jgi:RHS repeat-associated protein
LTAYSIDHDDRVKAVYDPTGAYTQTRFDMVGNVVVTLDGNLNTTTMTLDADDRVTMTTDPLGNSTKDYFDAAGNLTQVTDPNGNSTKYLFNADNRLTVTIDPLGDRTTQLYNARGDLTEVIDPNGNTTKYGFDADGRRTTVTDGAGQTTTTLYDANGNVTEVIDPLGHATQYLFDAENRLTVTIDPLNYRTTQLYDAVGNLTQVANADNDVTKYQYDADNRLTVTIDPLGYRVTTLYDADGQVTQVTDANGNNTQYLYDGAGRQLAVVNALGGRVTTLYDADGQVTGMLDALGRATTYLLNANGQATATVDPTGAETYQLFDANGNVTESKDADGHATSFAYDALNRLTLTTDALGNTTKDYYDAAGNVTGARDGNGNLTQNYYDADNRLTGTRDALGNLSQTLYNGNGQVTETIDANSNTVQFGYDADSRRTTVTDGTGQTTTTLYDGMGNVTQVTDPLGHSTQYLFDADGRQTVMIDALANRTTQLYDAVGNLTYVKDASNNVTTFAYDALNRKTAETAAIGSTTFAYNAVGDEISTTDALGQRLTFSYDGANRETGETMLNTGGSLQDRATFTYDAAGNMLTAANSQGTYTMLYNALNQVTLVHELFGQALTMSYDGAGNRTVVQDNFGTQTSVYDADERLETQNYAGISTTQVRVQIGYQANGELSTLTRYNMLGGPSAPIGSTTYLYDAANRATSITDYNGSGTALLSYAYTIDHASNVTQEVDNGTAVTYAYDADNQLTGAGGTTESYNATGNRNSTGYTTGSDNELTSDGTWNYTYNADGDVTQKVNISTGENWTYGYNDANEMTSAVDKTSGGTTLSSSAYEYDAFGNRVEQDVTVSGTTTVQRYAQDGWDPDTPKGAGNVKWEVFADLDGSNNLQTRYLRGDEVDQLFARIGSTGTAAWLLTDHLGSLVGVTDNSGTLQDTVAYDAFGNITSESASSWGGRYKWTGREFDTTTGLQYNRARYYNPKTGQWTSQDPMGFNAGDSNLYRYVSNRPCVNEDPSGFSVLVQVPVKNNPENISLYVQSTPLNPFGWTLGSNKRYVGLKIGDSGLVFRRASENTTPRPTYAVPYWTVYQAANSNSGAEPDTDEWFREHDISNWSKDRKGQAFLFTGGNASDRPYLPTTGPQNQLTLFREKLPSPYGATLAFGDDNGGQGTPGQRQTLLDDFPKALDLIKKALDMLANHWEDVVATLSALPNRKYTDILLQGPMRYYYMERMNRLIQHAENKDAVFKLRVALIALPGFDTIRTSPLAQEIIANPEFFDDGEVTRVGMLVHEFGRLVGIKGFSPTEEDLGSLNCINSWDKIVDVLSTLHDDPNAFKPKKKV